MQIPDSISGKLVTTAPPTPLLGQLFWWASFWVITRFCDLFVIGRWRLLSRQCIMGLMVWQEVSTSFV